MDLGQPIIFKVFGCCFKLSSWPPSWKASFIREHEAEVINFVGWRISEKRIAYPGGKPPVSRPSSSHQSPTGTPVYSSASVYLCIARIVLAWSSGCN
ncbi:hypothetical protein EDC04DRAFT_3074596 [Pisolithus marmoratus]|nr:hypothetical protein EDC04DRAFT_3074596 [Pisolithus marmoratus]